MRLTNSIYVYYIDPETEIVTDADTFDRGNEGIKKAKALVDKLEADGFEAFYTIGVLTKQQNLN